MNDQTRAAEQLAPLPYFVASGSCPGGEAQAQARATLSAPALALLPRLATGGGLVPSNESDKTLYGEFVRAGLADYRWNTTCGQIEPTLLAVDCLAMAQAPGAAAVVAHQDELGRWRWQYA